MIVVFDYGVGNLTSIMKMISKSGNSAVISSKKEDLESASKIILPGMGHFDNCMKKFNQSGMRDLITRRVFEEKLPLLGICVGLQMFFDSSEEGSEKGLGWVRGKVVRFDEKKFDNRLTIPNMGWLDVTPVRKSDVLEGLEGARFYFAHSYHVETENMDSDLISANYGYTFTAGVEQDNLVGVQFHPEKSHRFGMKLLQNFAENFS